MDLKDVAQTQLKFNLADVSLCIHMKISGDTVVNHFLLVRFSQYFKDLSFRGLYLFYAYTQ